ncbi:putative ribonuclease H-like domain-containing protein [Tanacetum coccineum]
MKKMYYLVVIDDYIRFSWVFFLATKDETSDILNKAFKVFNNRTRIVEENLHVQFSENTPNIAGSGPNWLFDIDALTKSMNYKLVVIENQSNGNAGTKACDDAGKARMKTVPGKDYILLPLWVADPLFSQISKSSPDAGFKPSGDNKKKVTEEPGKEGGDLSNDQEKEDIVNNTNTVNAASTNEVNVVGAKTSNELPDDPNMHELEDIVYSDDDEDVSAEADMNNLDAFMPVSPIPTKEIRLVAQGYTQEEGIDYDEVFAPVARIKAIRLFLAYASFKDFVVYQMDVKSAFLYGKIEEEVYKSLCTKFEKMIHKKIQTSSMGELTFFLGLQVKQKEDGIFISQDKYVTEILKKFGFTNVKTASTPMETQKPLLKDKDGKEVDVYLYRSMIGSLMYLTSSRPDIMFAMCACARYQVNPKVLHLHAVKRIFTYLKGQPKLGLWYPKDSPFDLVAYTDSDYAGASLDRKSTTGSCQFLGCRLISWQCKKQTMVANSTTEAEYVAVAKDSNEKKLIQMIKIHTDKNVADLLTKAFDVKTVNGEVQLQALVDGKKIIVTEASVRRDLQLNDEERPAQVREITSLKLRVKKLEKKGGSKTHNLKRLYKVGLSRRVESSDEEVSTHFDADTDMFGVHDLVGDEVVVETEVASKDVNLSVDEVTLAQALAALKCTKPKANKVMLQEPEQGIIATTAATTVTAASTRPKAKGLLIHEEEQATTPTVSSQ